MPFNDKTFICCLLEYSQQGLCHISKLLVLLHWYVDDILVTPNYLLRSSLIWTRHLLSRALIKSISFCAFRSSWRIYFCEAHLFTNDSTRYHFCSQQTQVSSFKLQIHKAWVSLEHQSLDLLAFTDVDWASSVDDRRSKMCSLAFLCLISWSSKKQEVAPSQNIEPCRLRLQKLSWLTILIQRAGCLSQSKPAHCLSTLKHIEADMHFIREKDSLQAELEVRFYIPTEEQIAGMFT